MSKKCVAIIGEGAWALALALVAARAGLWVILYVRTADKAAIIAHQIGDHRITITTDKEAVKGADAILIAVPTQKLRGAAKALSPFVVEGTPIIVCSKGIELTTQEFVTAIVAKEISQAIIAILSGPNIAAEVADDQPTGATLAASDLRLATALAYMLRSTNFSVCPSRDVLGVEILAALKNVYAIAAGITAALLGNNSVAAIIARGYFEVGLFAKACGRRPRPFPFMAGMGDFVVTCKGPASRNYSYGFAIGKGASPEEAERGKLVEGVSTARVLIEMAHKLGVKLPIAEAVLAIIKSECSVDEAMASFLQALHEDSF